MAIAGGGKHVLSANPALGGIPCTMKYVILFGAICVGSGLIATFWLWYYAERSISLRASSTPLAEGNGITQPLLADGHHSSQPIDVHPADAIEAQQGAVVTPVVFDAGADAAPGTDEQREEAQRNDSNSRSSRSSSGRKSSPQTVETLEGETTPEGDKGQHEASFDSLAAIQQPEESRTTSLAAQKEEQKQQEGSNGNSSSSSPVARADGDGAIEDEDPPAGKEDGSGAGAGAGAGTEELGEPREVLSSSGDPATAR